MALFEIIGELSGIGGCAEMTEALATALSVKPVAPVDKFTAAVELPLARGHVILKTA